MQDWLTGDGGCSIPDRDDLHADLTGVCYSYDSSGRLKLERKEDIKKRGLRSPDLADALALGRPIVDRYGGRYEGRVIDGLAAEQVAACLTKRIREKLMGDSAGFNRRIEYRDGPLV